MIKYTLLLILAISIMHSALQSNPTKDSCREALSNPSSVEARCIASHYSEKAAYWQDHIFNEGYTADMRNNAQKIAHLYASIAHCYESLINHAPATRSAIIERDIKPLIEQAARLEKALPGISAPETMYEKIQRLEKENAALSHNHSRSAQSTRRTYK